MKPPNEISDIELIEFCEKAIAEKVRPFFHKSVVRRMIALAGFPENFASGEDLDRMPQQRFLMTAEMKELCELARANLSPTDNCSRTEKPVIRRLTPKDIHEEKLIESPSLKLTLTI